MISISYLRNDFKSLKTLLSGKKFECDLDLVLELDQKRREAISMAERARAGQKATNNEMAKLQKGTTEFIAKVGEMKILAAEVKELEAKARSADNRFKEAFMTIPNIPHDSVPDGRGEEDNQVVDSWGEANGDFENAIPHYDIPWFEQMIDFPRGVKVTPTKLPTTPPPLSFPPPGPLPLPRVLLSERLIFK